MKLLNIFETGDCLAESPVWNTDDQRLWYTDIDRAVLNRLDPDTGRVERISLPERLGSFCLVAGTSDRAMGAFESGFGWIDVHTGAIDWLARPELGNTGRRFNDGRCDRSGHFWAGTAVEDERLADPASGALFKLGPDAGATVMDQGFAVSNGLAFSPEGDVLYFSDSRRAEIYSYALRSDGTLGPRTLFSDITDGKPDGATVDVDGHLWSALWGGSKLAQFDGTGRRIAEVALPLTQPTSLAFGGPDLTWVFVTSASKGDASDHNGSILMYQSSRPGLPEGRFGSDVSAAE